MYHMEMGVLRTVCEDFDRQLHEAVEDDDSETIEFFTDIIKIGLQIYCDYTSFPTPSVQNLFDKYGIKESKK